MRARFLGCLAFLTVLLAAEARAQTIINWQALSGTPDGSCPWTLADTSPQNPSLASGVLTLSTTSRSETMDYTQSGSALAVPATWIIRANVRVVSENHDAGPRRGVAIGFEPAANVGNVLCLGVDEVFLWSSFGVQGPTSNVDTDGAPHDYRIEVDVAGDGLIRVYQDEVEILSGAMFTNSQLTGSQIYWGDGSGNAAAVSEWRSFEHNGSACGCTVGGPVLWTAAGGGNNHIYDTVGVPGGLAWQEARDAAFARGGYLATITSAEEDAFVFGVTCSRLALYRLDSAGNGQGPWTGALQPPGSPETNSGWTWITGEPWVYTNWEAGEPNDCCSSDPGEEQVMSYLKLGGLIGNKWGDSSYGLQKGYILEMDRMVAPGPASTACISTATPCAEVPIRIVRSDPAFMAGYSVKIQLSANLDLCDGVSSITEGSYLSSVGVTHFEVTSNGGGLYTVDGVTLGQPCGATGSGTLFNVGVKRNGSDGTGTVSVTAVVLRDCDNHPLACGSGLPTSITIDTSLPSPVTLSSAQRKTGNTQPPTGTTDIQLTWSTPEGGTTLTVYRKGFGGYPDYDEAGGIAPSTPATPAAATLAGWALSPVATSGGYDRTSARDFYYYVAYVTDACGNSAVSNRTGGTLNYHLGDTHDGVTDCAGDDAVTTSDFSFLGTHYGATGIPTGSPIECLDVGPTTDFSVDARPATDHRLQFEDLLVFALNFERVSAPQAAAAPVSLAAANRLRLVVPSLPPVGELLEVGFEWTGAGDLQGFTSQLSYDRNVVEFVAAEAGPLLFHQAGPGVALSSGDGNVDVAVLGRGIGLRGEGQLARAIFRVRSSGDANLALESVEGRDAMNRAVSLGLPVSVDSRAAASVLSRPMPTPFRDATTLEYALAQDGPAELAIYTVQGRRVRVLIRGVETAGLHRVKWDGRDDDGRVAAAGVYYVRLLTGRERRSTTLIRVP